MFHNVLELLENRVRIAPDALAFGDVDGDITFFELQQKAKAIGSYLTGKIKPAQSVTFFMEKSVLNICGMLGSIYAGGFYTVLDMKQPKARVAGIIEKLDSKVLLTDRENYEDACGLKSELPEGKMLDIICLEDIVDTRIDDAALDYVRSVHIDVNPLYVNFTSGSTGTPKGVTVSHRSVLEFMEYFVDIFDIRENDIIGNQAPYDFDVSVKDIYSGLMTGAKVQIIPKKYFSKPTMLMDYLAEKEVTVLIWAVSAMCFVSVMNGLEYRVPEKIRMVMFSGEVLPIKHLNKWKKDLPNATYINLYGPTEITCNCTYYVLDREFEMSEVIPIGKAFPNEKVFLLDEGDREVTEPGVDGEICVSGTAVALGYFGELEKTSEVFVQNPLNKLYLEPIYRTGDIAKYDTDGNLVYVSRKDFQIKHLGHRIELGEIEAIVTARDGVTRSCCLYDKEKQRLNLFYTGERNKIELMKELREVLPPFMLPNALYPIEEMPLNKNGKIDRNYLADSLKK